MNKEELVSYIHMLYRNWTSCDKTCQNLINHAKKLSDSNDELRKQLYFCEPYRFEDLKKVCECGMIKLNGFIESRELIV